MMIKADSGSPGWQELRSNLCHLLHNVGFPPDEMAYYDKRHDDIGF
jgi:hypothetical protein